MIPVPWLANSPRSHFVSSLELPLHGGPGRGRALFRGKRTGPVRVRLPEHRASRRATLKWKVLCATSPLEQHGAAARHPRYVHGDDCLAGPALSVDLPSVRDAISYRENEVRWQQVERIIGLDTLPGASPASEPSNRHTTALGHQLGEGGSQCHRRSTDSPDGTASHLPVPSRAHNEIRRAAPRLPTTLQRTGGRSRPNVS